MKATDLRIGNLVNYRVEDELDERKEWDEENTIDGPDLAFLHELDKSHTPSAYSPIPLTENKLLMLAFTRGKKPGIWVREVHVAENDSYTFQLIMRKQVLYFDFITCGQPLANRLDYVHELQNLYHVITGYELIKKPTPPTSEGIKEGQYPKS